MEPTEGLEPPDRLITNQTHYQTVLRWRWMSVDAPLDEGNGRTGLLLNNGQIQEH